MSATSITYLVAACAGVFSIAAWAGLVLAPAWGAYARVWQRLAATVLAVYVLVAFVVLGVAAGAGVLFFFGERL